MTIEVGVPCNSSTLLVSVAKKQSIAFGVHAYMALSSGKWQGNQAE